LAQARYFDPDQDESVEQEVADPAQFAEVLAAAGRLSSERGSPAVELSKDDGSALVLARSGASVALLWMDALGSSFHSVGDPEADDLLTVDYFGSHTEIPRMFAVPLDTAVAAADAYLTGSDPAVSGLVLEPD
jgi:Immunity protein Imm1